MLRDHRAHEQAAVASPLDREFLWPRPFLLDQVFRGRRKIIEHVLFFREIASLVPFLAELAATADVCHDVNAAAIKPEPTREIEAGRHADAVATVAVKQRRIIPIKVRSFSPNDVERNFCAVFGGCEVTRHFDVCK